MDEFQRLTIVMRMIELLGKEECDLTYKWLVQTLYIAQQYRGLMPDYNITVLADGPMSLQLTRDLKQLAYQGFIDYKDSHIAVFDSIPYSNSCLEGSILPWHEIQVRGVGTLVGDWTVSTLLNTCLIINAVIFMDRHTPELKMTVGNISDRVRTLSPQVTELTSSIWNAEAAGFIIVEEEERKLEEEEVKPFCAHVRGPGWW